MSKTVRLGLLGLGTVGQGVFKIVEENRNLIERRTGVHLEVTAIAVRDAGLDRGVEVPAGIMTTDAGSVARSPGVDIVVELIGGSDTARGLVLQAMGAGKHVVTANKALLAEHGAEIRKAADAAGVSLGFEASVAGGIPVIKTLRESLAANRVLSIYGIINGTCNYILTTMSEEDRPFDEVLKEAQDAGYAESDPAFDVGGIDSAHKLAILVNLAFGIPVRLDQVHTEGITGISPVDIEFGREFGYTLKLLAIAKSSPAADGSVEVEARVHPTFVPDDYPIAQVGGVYNAVQIVGDSVGDLMLYGKGAGETTHRERGYGRHPGHRNFQQRHGKKFGDRRYPRTDSTDHRNIEPVLPTVHRRRQARRSLRNFGYPGALQYQHRVRDSERPGRGA